MGKCDNCRLRKESEKAFDIHWLGEDDCPYDKCPVPDFPKTNADRIRSMTDEELDKFLGDVQWDVANYCGGVTQKQEYPVPEQMGAWLDWLKQEAKE